MPSLNQGLGQLVEVHQNKFLKLSLYWKTDVIGTGACAGETFRVVERQSACRGMGRS